MYLHFRLMCFKEGKLNKNTQQKKGWRVAKGVFLCKKTCARSSLLLLKVMGCRLLGNWVISFKSVDLYWCIQFEALAQSLLKRSQTRRDFIFLFSAFSFVNAFGQRTCDLWALLAAFKVLLQWYIAQTKLQQNPPAEMDPGDITWVEIV